VSLRPHFTNEGEVSVINESATIDIQALTVGAEALGVRLNEQQIGQFAQYAALLEEWNARMNLTRVAPQDTVPLHFLDSLTVSAAAEASLAGRLLDVGTGAGFPGVPLKIAHPELSVTLMDSTRKKLDFLDAVIGALGLRNIKTIHIRAEDAMRASEHYERYDVVTARAVARLNVLAGWMLPFVKPGGIAVAMKSATSDEEIEEAENVIKVLRGVIGRKYSVRIPGTDIGRKIVVIRKGGTTPFTYSRNSR
jgi:16S rRNA (guanine527-N7)-methyltransferase